MAKQLISIDEATPRPTQHTQPCSDCPWARGSLRGWLGGASVDEWLRAAHSDTYVPCHTTGNQQCAGLAIYRNNTCKRVDPPLLTLPKDREACFSNMMEFREHHERPWQKRDPT